MFAFRAHSSPHKNTLTHTYMYTLTRSHTHTGDGLPEPIVKCESCTRLRNLASPLVRSSAGDVAAPAAANSERRAATACTQVTPTQQDLFFFPHLLSQGKRSRVTSGLKGRSRRRGERRVMNKEAAQRQSTLIPPNHELLRYTVIHVLRQMLFFLSVSHCCLSHDGDATANQGMHFHSLISATHTCTLLSPLASSHIQRQTVKRGGRHPRAEVTKPVATLRSWAREMLLCCASRFEVTLVIIYGCLEELGKVNESQKTRRCITTLQ